MKTFDYIRPASIAEAVAAAAEPGTAYLAGGTNLLDLMKGGITRQPPRRRLAPAGA
jgi:xanthine dehydrogenase YagS FAD-binding subunit